MRVITESLSPPDIERMKAAVSRLAGGPGEGPEGAADEVSIDLLVTGGCPSERVQFRASLHSWGAAEVSYVDELRRVSEQFSAAVRPDELAALVRRLDVDALTTLPPNADERYLPDSLVGSVIIKTGSSRIMLRFLLEDEAPPPGEETAMKIDPGQGPFVLRASMAPPSVRPVLEQLAAVVNRLFQHRR